MEVKMRLIDILTNLKNWSFEINGPYRLQQAEAQTIRDSFADLLFLEFLKKEIPAEQMDELLHRYNGSAEKGDSNDES
jgi:hypothetical protein